jgi:hypothetical protein
MKQFKKDFENIKETLKAFEEVNTEKYLETIEKLIIPTEPHKEKDKNENENENEKKNCNGSCSLSDGHNGPGPMEDRCYWRC